MKDENKLDYICRMRGIKTLISTPFETATGKKFRLITGDQGAALMTDGVQLLDIQMEGEDGRLT